MQVAHVSSFSLMIVPCVVLCLVSGISEELRHGFRRIQPPSFRLVPATPFQNTLGLINTLGTPPYLTCIELYPTV
jgi:hypothetical protein